MPQPTERTSAYLAKTLEELRQMSDEDLVRAHDQLIKGSGQVHVGINYYREEISRRESVNQGRRLERLTWAIVILTIVLVLLTGVLIWLELRHA